MLCLSRNNVLSPPCRCCSGKSFPLRPFGGFAPSLHHLLEPPPGFGFVPHPHGAKAGNPAGVVVDHLAHAARGAGEAEEVGDGEVVEDCDEDFWGVVECG